MMKILGFIILLALVSFAGAWLADNNGAVLIHFLDYEISLSLVALFCVSFVLWGVFFFLLFVALPKISVIKRFFVRKGK